VELADLTRGMRKKYFLEPEKLILQSRVCLSFMRAVPEKKNRARKVVFFGKARLV